jgi:4-hydroxybutyryl-CoA dehydratase/vinylacetyl-CoA-Delta-isomerase
MLMSAQEYRDSLRRYRPRVFVNGDRVQSVADDPRFGPGINAIGVTYDLALQPAHQQSMQAIEASSGKETNRMLHINRDCEDLLTKLEAVRLVCRETGCAQRYLSHDALNAIYQTTYRMDQDVGGSDYHSRFINYLHDVQARDLTLGVAMTDGKGDRKLRPHQQANLDAYVRIKACGSAGIVISGTKAIVTGAPYVHELLVLPCRSMTQADSQYALCCAVPVDAQGLTIVSRPAGRPGDPAAQFSRRYGQSTAVCLFDDVFVPWNRIFMAGEWAHSGFLVHAYASHHRHSCIAARAGFGDLLIGAGMLMSEANGLDPGSGHLRNAMVELIKMVEGFYACGVAASVYGVNDSSGAWQPEPVFANVGKLLLATQIYDMQRLAHEVSGGLVVALPGPDEDHNPETAGDLALMLRGREDIPYAQRAEVARFIQDLTASDTGGWYSVISLHGGGSPEAMKREIFRRYPLQERRALVERLLERGALSVSTSSRPRRQQIGRCCPAGCKASELDIAPGHHVRSDSTSRRQPK